VPGDDAEWGHFPEIDLIVEGTAMLPQAVDFSVVISSRNRAHALSGCFDALTRAALNATDMSLELVFVDNNSTDGTAEIVRQWSATAPLPVTIVHETKPGLSNARNAGIMAAKGRILAFTDDDCEVAPDYFHVLAGLFADDATTIMRGGRVDLGDERDLPITIKTDDERAVLTHDLHAGGFIHGCNMAFPKALVEKIGLFDPRFGAGAQFRSGEDTDYIHRAFAAGITVEYRPELKVKHFHGRRDLNDIKKLHNGYSFGNGALYAKYMFDRRSNMRGMLRWDIRQALKEAFGGSKLDAAMGLTYRATVQQNLAGVIAYWRRPAAF
jgi:glycosyltransferase involved in cell wall biosynthesis